MTKLAYGRLGLRVMPPVLPTDAAMRNWGTQRFDTHVVPMAQLVPQGARLQRRPLGSAKVAVEKSEIPSNTMRAFTSYLGPPRELV